MILSVSRRTDIIAFYLDWFFNRLREGYVLVRNPMNYRQVSKVYLNPSDIDCIVFWTKDPTNILERLDMLNNYFYYFHVTITGYDKVLELTCRPKKDYTILSGAFEKGGKRKDNMEIRSDSTFTGYRCTIPPKKIRIYCLLFERLYQALYH